MKKILLSIALVLGVPAMLFADRIPADKALRIAREFVGNSVPSSMMKQACIREIPVLASQTDDITCSMWAGATATWSLPATIW